MSVSKAEEVDNCVESIPPVQLDTLSQISFLLLLSVQCLGPCVNPMILTRSQPSFEEAIDKEAFELVAWFLPGKDAMAIKWALGFRDHHYHYYLHHRCRLYIVSIIVVTIVIITVVNIAIIIVVNIINVIVLASSSLSSSPSSSSSSMQR